MVLTAFTGCGREKEGAISAELTEDLDKSTGNGVKISQIDEGEAPMDMQQKLQALDGLVEGDIFKDFIWKGPYINAGSYQRVTGPNATAAGAARYLPNRINHMVIDDLEHAVKAEMIVELWGGHAGTADKRVRLNSNEWLSVPESEHVGAESRHEYYYQFRYPKVDLPLEHIKEGNNILEFTCGGTVSWPQWGVYSVTFRIYYDQEKQHTTGNIVPLDNGGVIGDGHTFEVEVDGSPEQVMRVDYVGFYEDFDYNGDGIYDEWQCSYKYGEIKNNVGSSDATPFSVKWDSTWVPDQKKEMKVAAIITNTDGISYVTNPLTDIRLERDTKSIMMYKTVNVPEKYGVNNQMSVLARLNIDADLSKAEEAKLTIVTWNGAGTASFELNANIIANTLGKNHNYGIDEFSIPLEYIREGANYFVIRAVPYHDNEHGVEALWPGAVIKVMYPK